MKRTSTKLKSRSGFINRFMTVLVSRIITIIPSQSLFYVPEPFRSKLPSKRTSYSVVAQTCSGKGKKDVRNGLKRFPTIFNNKKSQFLIAASKLFLGLAVVCFIIFLNLLVLHIFPVPKQISFATTDKKIPVEISIKAVHIDIPIYKASFQNGSFATTTQGASYLISSPLPGETGNSIIYAHNWWNLFGNLYNVKKGEKIEITFSDTSKKAFTIISTQTVPAKQVSILHNTTDNRLTIFTCTDFLDADRFVVTAMFNK